MKRSSLATAAILVCSAAPLAVGQAPTQQAAASSPSAQLDWFVGQGICTANAPAVGSRPARTSTGKFHSEKALDGRWVVIHYDEDRTAAIPSPFRVEQYIGYDAVQKHFVSVTFDNSGGTYETGVSSGLTGNTMTFDLASQMNGKPVQSRDVFTIPQSGVWTHIGMLRDESGKWITIDKEICHKP